MKTAYIALVSFVSSGIAAYLAPSHPYWMTLTVPSLIILSIHFATYTRQALRHHRRLGDTHSLMGEECPVCAIDDLEVTSDNEITCRGCATVYAVSPRDGLVDRRYPRKGIS